MLMYLLHGVKFQPLTGIDFGIMSNLHIKSKNCNKFEITDLENYLELNIWNFNWR